MTYQVMTYQEGHMTETQRLVEIAGDLVQRQGFERTSFHDLSQQADMDLGAVKKIFPSKNALGMALVEYSFVIMRTYFADIEQVSHSPEQKLQKFLQVFIDISKDPAKFCLCGMLAAELGVLSDEVQDHLSTYFAEAQAWLAAVFADLGSDYPEEEGRAYLAMMEGALLMARLEGRPDRLIEASTQFLRRYQMAA